jgi:hypothetical protein
MMVLGRERFPDSETISCPHPSQRYKPECDAIEPG